jgi:hypothetical protein
MVQEVAVQEVVLQEFMIQQEVVVLDVLLVVQTTQVVVQYLLVEPAAGGTADVANQPVRRSCRAAQAEVEYIANDRDENGKSVPKRFRLDKKRI